MTLEIIRKGYGVPAKRGACVEYTHPNGTVENGVITQSRGARLLILLEGSEKSRLFHPTWNIKYL